MSVKRVKISELPQLQPDTSGEGIFMPAADENNHTYRVPLSRYGKSAAGGDLVGEFPNPTIKSSVELTGSPTAPTPSTDNDSTRVATTAYVKAVVANIDARPTGVAGGDLASSYPNPTIKSSVNLSGSPTTTTQATSDNSTKVATTAFVKKNLESYVATSDARLSDSRIPKGVAGGDLTGTYPNPSIKSSVYLPGSPTTTTQNGNDSSTKIATTAFVRYNSPVQRKVQVLNSTSDTFRTWSYKRGGRKANTERALLGYIMLQSLDWSFVCLIGNTRNSVLITDATDHASNNNIYQTADGMFVNFVTMDGGEDAKWFGVDMTLSDGGFRRISSPIVLPAKSDSELKSIIGSINILQYI